MSIHTLLSPDGRVWLTLALDGGRLYFATGRDGVATSERSPLGIATADCDFGGGLTLVGEERGAIDEQYRLPAFKKAVCRDHANTTAVGSGEGWPAAAGAGPRLRRRRGVRLIVPGGRGPGAEWAWWTRPPPSRCRPAPGSVAQRLLFTYEDHYLPVPVAKPQNALAFPRLLDAGHGVWALYAGGGRVRRLCRQQLLAAPEFPARLKVTRSPVNWGRPGPTIPSPRRGGWCSWAASTISSAQHPGKPESALHRGDTSFIHPASRPGAG